MTLSLGVNGAIWVGDGIVPASIAAVVAESASVDVDGRDLADVAADVAALDEAPTLS